MSPFIVAAHLFCFQIRGILSFIDDNRNSLNDFEKSYCLNIRSALRMKSIADFEGSLVSIGVTLCMREVCS
jgi:hypothetical protein